MNRQVFGYLVPYWRRLVLVLAISLISTATTLVIPYLSKDLIDNALVGRDLGALRRIVYWFIALGVLGFVLNVTSGLRYTRVSAEILFDMRLSLYAHLQRLSPRFYARTRLGDIVSRLNNDISEIQRVAAEAALAWVGNVLFLIGSLVMMVWLDWRLALIALAPMPISLLALAYYRRRLESRVADLRQRSADIGSFLIETLQAASLVVASNAQQREQDRFRGLNGAFIDALMRMQRVTYFAGGLPGTVLSIGSAIAFFYGGLRVIDGSLTLGTMGAFLAYQMRVFAPAQALMGLYASIATAKVSWSRVLEILDAPIDVIERPDAKTIERPRGELTFESVTLGTDRSRVLDAVSFTASPGQIVALVGGSGVGKSTIAYLATRLLDPDAGAVRLDGEDLREPDADERAPTHRPRRAGADAVVRDDRGEHPLRTAGCEPGRGETRRRGRGNRQVRPGIAAGIRHDRRRARPGGIRRGTPTHRAGARLSRRSRRAGHGRAHRGTRCDRPAPGDRRLTIGDARPHHHPDHAPARGGDGGGSRRGPRRRPRGGLGPPIGPR